jgi:hypothetical protein
MYGVVGGRGNYLISPPTRFYTLISRKRSILGKIIVLYIDKFTKINIVFCIKVTEETFYFHHILSVLLLSSCLLKPPVTEGILKGQVIVPEGSIQTKDPTGEALPDAILNIIDLETSAVIATTTTDADGYYQISVPPGGPYLLEAIKDGIKIQQITSQVEVGIEYELGTADCTTTAVTLIAQAMLDAEDYPNNIADIDLTDIEADPNFDDVKDPVCTTIQAGQDPTVSTAILQAVEAFIYPPTPATLESIAITTPATKLSYNIDDALDITGLEVTGTYSDSTTKVETITNGNITGFDSSAPAVDQLLTITFGGKTTTYTVTIVPTPLTAIAAITGTAQAGETLTAGALTPSGATADYQWQICTTSDGTYIDISGATSATYTPVADDVTKFIKVAATGTGNYSGTVTSDPTTAVAPATLESIAITTPATKLSYNIDDALDITGLEVTGTYSDSTTKVETITTGNITGFDSSAPEVDQLLTITFGGKTTTYTVTIVPTPLTAIAAITGTAQAGETLTAGALTPSGATADYQWQICTTSDGTYIDISGATSATYTPVADDVTKFIKVAATGTGNYSGTVTSDPTTAVAAIVIDIAAIPGVTAPVTGAIPVDTITETDQYTGTVTWSPDHSPFGGSTVYTATITLTAKAGYTLTGVIENFFTVADATTVTNAVNSGEVTAAFTATAEVAVGDNCGGGIVAYILQSGDPGYDASVQHGLIAAAANQSTSAPWGCYETSISGANGTAVGTGEQNTIDIEAGCATHGTAADICANLSLGGYNDWFLPSLDELVKLYNNKDLIGGFGWQYWSSSEYSSADAWTYYFDMDDAYYPPKNYLLYVRAVRYF